MIVAVIPCYNEEKTIDSIVKQCLQYVDEVVVADDQSTDCTIAVAMDCGAKVVQTMGNHGPGKAYRIGIKTALRYGADIIVTLDGDGQHNPDEIPKLLRQLEYCDMINTSRFLDNRTNMPLYRRLGIWVITLAFNLGHKVWLTDSQCGFRAFKKKVFESVTLTENGFGYSTEILIKIRKANFRIKEIPTIVKYFSDFSQNSSTNPVKHGIEVLKDTLKWRFKCELLS